MKFTSNIIKLMSERRVHFAYMHAKKFAVNILYFEEDSEYDLYVGVIRDEVFEDLAGLSCIEMPPGKTIEDAKRNIREAIQQHIQSLLSHQQPIPQNDKLVHVEELTVGVP